MRRVEVSSSPGPSPFSHSPECVEGGFCELRMYGVLRSSCIISPRGNMILEDAHPSQREHPVAVTWPRDRRVKAQESYLPSF
jgi:hypothetical protein